MIEQILRQGVLLKNGEYRILGLLGQGGFGITYEAEQVSLGRKVAIKEFFMRGTCERIGDTASVSVPVTESRALVSRFKDKFIREARLIAAMDNPHIVKIYDVFEENGTAYYVMESIQGGSLSALVKTEGPLPEDVAIEYIKQVGEALSYVHKRKVLHLDVKPANILLRKEEEEMPDQVGHDRKDISVLTHSKAGKAVLIDFGISKRYDEAGQQTSSTPVGISEGYAPFEQYRTGDISKFSPATDVYSLGATLYYLVTGEVPPTASDIIADGGLKRPQFVSDAVWNAISAAMQYTVKSRPQSVAVFLVLLSAKSAPAPKPAPVVPNEGTVIAGPDRQSPKTPDHVGGDVRKNPKKTTWIALSSAAVAFVILLSIVLLGGGKTPSDTPVVQDTSSVAQNVVTPSKLEKPTPAPPVEPVKEETFEIIISSNPSGARVFIDGKDKKETTPATIKDLKAGSYKVTLKMEGYEEQSKTVTFKKGGALYSKVSLTLNKEAEKTGSAKIESTPAGATIYIDGKSTGLKTPDIVENLTVGSHSVKLTLDGYKDATGSVTITADKRASFSKALEAKPAPQPAPQPAVTTSGTGTISGHEWVDLGLSVKWATTNVGASTPGDYGRYYAWGETSPKSSYYWSNLKYCTDNSGNHFSKYNTESNYGPVDNKTRLDLSDDAARQNWGGSWRMPTDAEWTELRTKCTWTWTVQNGHNGYKVTAPNGRSIFLPAAGWQGGSSSYSVGSDGYYWSSSLNTRDPYGAWSVSFNSSEVGRRYDSRYCGQSVRPVTE